MTAALLKEDRISLLALAEREGVHYSTVSRWCTEGFKGHRLESFIVGGKRFTSLQAYYERWLQKINETELAEA